MRALLLGVPLLLVLAACGPEGRAVSGPGLYIALGDSLSAGVGASDRGATAFVPRVSEGLGEEIDLLNMGHSGDTSLELLDHGHLGAAVAEVERLNGDDDSNNDVKLVTLEIGGNDLLDLFFSLVLSGRCPALEQSLLIPQCVDPLRDTLDRFGPNLGMALDRLQEADPGLTIVVMTLYDPFSGGLETISELVELALEGMPDTPFPEGLNDIIRSEVAERELVLVDWYPLFEGKGNEYIAGDFIHPNDAGYQVMADAVLREIR